MYVCSNLLWILLVWIISLKLMGSCGTGCRIYNSELKKVPHNHNYVVMMLAVYERKNLNGQPFSFYVIQPIL